MPVHAVLFPELSNSRGRAGCLRGSLRGHPAPRLPRPSRVPPRAARRVCRRCASTTTARQPMPADLLADATGWSTAATGRYRAGNTQPGARHAKTLQTSEQTTTAATVTVVDHLLTCSAWPRVQAMQTYFTRRWPRQLLRSAICRRNSSDPVMAGQAPPARLCPEQRRNGGAVRCVAVRCCEGDTLRRTGRLVEEIRDFRRKFWWNWRRQKAPAE